MDKKTHKGRLFELDYGKDIKIDLKDKKIISILGENCRTTHATIAKSINTSKDSVRYRIKQLIDKDIYRGGITIINPFSFGFPVYSILIKLKSITPEKEDKLISFLENHGFIIWFGKTQGEYDFHILMNAKDMVHFDKLLREIQKRFTSNLKDIKVLHMTKVYASHTVPLEFQKEADVKLKPTKLDSSFHFLLNEPYAHIGEGKLDLSMREILILRELADNASLSLQEISEKTKIKPDTVKNTIKNLVKKHTILAFRALINVSFLKYHGYIVYFKLSPDTTSTKRKEFESYFRHSITTSFGTEASGSYYDVIIYALSKNPLEFNRWINDIRNKFSDIIEDYDVDLILKDYKFTFFPKGLLPPIKQAMVKLGAKLEKD